MWWVGGDSGSRVCESVAIPIFTEPGRARTVIDAHNPILFAGEGARQAAWENKSSPFGGAVQAGRPQGGDGALNQRLDADRRARHSQIETVERSITIVIASDC